MHRLSAVQRRLNRENKAATDIIRIFRGWTVRKYAQERLYGRKAIEIQCAWRQFRARREAIIRKVGRLGKRRRCKRSHPYACLPRSSTFRCPPSCDILLSQLRVEAMHVMRRYFSRYIARRRFRIAHEPRTKVERPSHNTHTLSHPT